VLIQPEFTLLDQRQGGDGMYGFANRGRLKQGSRCNGPFFGRICPAVAFGPNNLVVINNGDAYAIYMIISHAVADLPAGAVRNFYPAAQVIFNSFYLFGGGLRPGFPSRQNQND